MSSVALFYAPILFGGAMALMLSGIAAVQCIIFFRLYPNESSLKIVLVAIVCTEYMLTVRVLKGYANLCCTSLLRAEDIPVKNWWLTGPIICLASLRLLAAIVATAEMLKLKRWDAFSKPYPRLLFTSGLSLSAGTDLIITICLCYYLRKIRKLSSSSVMKSVLDTLTLYTLENGLITCLTTTGSLTFWLLLPASGLSLSLHFVIGKLYPNSLLILLNTSKDLRDMHAGDQGVHIDTSENLATYYLHFPHRIPVSHHIDHFPFTAPLPVYGYRPAFKMPKAQAEVKVQRTVARNSMAMSEADSFDMQRAYARPRSPGNTSLHWRALP
ncbi:Glycoside hydrolase [Mycena sanguinolenta]|uniref:Glycoside hydrolase n=1 Tax=Mycena sanguinolenta TaxID=230812 RepID=A0A8H6Y081_9AGAR|nr:Glycoside hydrolase [Mycena sanguinolenta]